MRYLHVAAPAGRASSVEAILREYELDYTEVAETGDGAYDALFAAPVPIEAIQPLLDEFRAVGLEENAHVVVQDAEAVVSSRFGELQRHYDAFSPDERIAHDEIRIAAKNLVPDEYTFLLLSVVSAVVATAGMLLDSASIVVGSMVIAPLVGPAMATGVGTALNDSGLFRKGAKYQLVGFGFAVVSATVFAVLVRVFFLIPPNVEITAIEQISGRISPDLLSLVVALGSGAAGARSLEADVSTPLIGVMIAAALIPPTAAVGIGIAWGLPNVVLRSGLLVLVNTLSVNLCALAVLWHSGIRSSDQSERAQARVTTRRRTVVLVVGIVVLSAFLGVFSWNAYQAGASEQAIENDVTTILKQEQYTSLSLVEVRIEHQSQGLRSRPAAVVVTVTRPDGQRYPRLDDRIDRQIDHRADRDVETRVRYITVEASA